MTNYFKNKIDKDYANNSATKIRWDKTLEFMSRGQNFKSALDIGDRTGLTEMMENEYSVSFDNTKGDLDNLELKGNYDLVTSFEVLEHLFNHLFNLEQINNVLNQNGYLFLSTPMAKPDFYGQKNISMKCLKDQFMHCLNLQDLRFCGTDILEFTHFYFTPAAYVLWCDFSLIKFRFMN